MRDYWLTKDLLQTTGIAFIALSLAGIALALWLPKKWWGKLLAVAAVGFLISIPVRQGTKEIQQQQVQVDDYKERYVKAKALFDERCKTAGEKIYRTVENVEGIQLLNIRTGDVAANRANQKWDGAGLPNERTENEYIRTFLYWEQHQDKRNSRGYINSYPSELPGYRYLDVKNTDGAYTNYTLDVSDRDHPQLVAKPTAKSQSRYAVSTKSVSTTEDSNQWIAGFSVKVEDTNTQETLAEAVWYAFEPGLGNTSGGRSPWGFAINCPKAENASQIRFFVDQVLKVKGK